MDLRVFTNEMKVFLIDYVKNHRCLWCPTDENYFNKIERNDVMQELRKLIREKYNMDYNVYEIKTKWKHLRTTFLRVHKIMTKKGTLHKPHWIYYTKMKFLLDSFNEKSSRGYTLQEAANQYESSCNNQEMEFVEAEEEQTSSEVLETEKAEKGNKYFIVESTHPDITVLQPVVQQHSSPVVQQHNSTVVQQHSSPIVQQHNNSVVQQQTAQPNENDHVDDFFNFLKKSIRLLPDRKQQIAMEKIHIALASQFNDESGN